MLSDSLHDACETIWEAVQNYDYSEDFKDELVDSLVKLNYIIYRLDRLSADCTWSEEDMKKHILKKWAKRNCSV